MDNCPNRWAQFHSIVFRYGVQLLVLLSILSRIADCNPIIEPEVEKRLSLTKQLLYHKWSPDSLCVTNIHVVRAWRGKPKQRYWTTPEYDYCHVLSNVDKRLEAQYGMANRIRGTSNNFRFPPLRAGNHCSKIFGNISRMRRSALPVNCFTPDGADCSWYRRCLAEQYRCGDEGYPIGFAERICLSFERTFSKFSARAQTWVGDVRKCLQVKLVPVLNTTGSRPQYTCEKLKQIAFDTHVPCYLHPADGVSLCQLTLRDFLLIGWILKAEFIPFSGAAEETWKGFLLAMKGCGFGREVSNDDTLNAMLIKISAEVDVDDDVDVTFDVDAVADKDFDADAADDIDADNGVDIDNDVEVRSRVRRSRSSDMSSDRLVRHVIVGISTQMNRVARNNIGWSARASKMACGNGIFVEAVVADMARLGLTSNSSESEPDDIIATAKELVRLIGYYAAPARKQSSESCRIRLYSSATEDREILVHSETNCENSRVLLKRVFSKLNRSDGHLKLSLLILFIITGSIILVVFLVIS